MLVSSSVDVKNIQEVNDDVIVVNWQYSDDACEVLSPINVVLVAITTALARCNYSFILKLSKNKYFTTT